MAKFIFALFLFLPCSISAQYLPLDILQRQLSTAPNDTVRISIYSQLGTYYDDVNVDSSVYYNETGVKLARRLGLKLNEAELHMNMSFPLAKMGNYPKTLNALMQAKEIAEDVSNEKYVANLNGDSPRNYRLKMLGYTYLGLGFLYARTGDNEKRIGIYQEATRLAESIKDTLLLGQILGDMGDAYFYLNKMDSARSYLNQSVAYFSALPVELRKFEGSVFLSLGVLYLKTGQPSLAKENFENAISISKLVNNAAYLGEGYLRLAGFYQSAGKPDSSLYYYKKTLDTYKGLGIDNNKVLAYRMISDFYLQHANKDSSFAYLRMAVLLNDSLSNLERSRLQEFQNIGFKEQFRLRELEEERVKASNRLRIYALFTGLGILALLAFIFYRNNRQKQKVNLLLKEEKTKLETALSELKTTQQQLIQSEKMASLGELTAGIAHEIQNPLNFVNNFSEVSNELLEEMKTAMAQGNSAEAEQIANDLIHNLEKINHHGKRADSIVKGMLQHSRTGSATKEPVDINKLADEYLRLCYKGLQAKDRSFNAVINTEFDSSLPMITVIRQDMGRALLNILVNAFYAANERRKHSPDHEPKVSISTGKIGSAIQIRITDNGSGIPKDIIDKIFQPFFTTKPTGEGTGLGLSLSYDIITKGHGGELRVETNAAGTTFIIQLNP